MPGLDRQIDPRTGDYVDADGGEFRETRTIATACYHQLKTERDRWWGDPDAGSDLHLLKHRGLGRGAAVFAEDAIRAALQPFVDQGLAADVEVAAETTEYGQTIIDAAITDVAAGRLDLTDIASVGQE